MKEMKTHQDDGGHKDEVDEEITRLGECGRRRFEAASVGEEEVGIHEQAKFRSSQDEAGHQSPYLGKCAKCEDVVLEEHDHGRVNQPHPHGDGQEDSRRCDCSTISIRSCRHFEREGLAYLEMGGAAQNISAADMSQGGMMINLGRCIGVRSCE